MYEHLPSREKANGLGGLCIHGVRLDEIGEALEKLELSLIPAYEINMYIYKYVNTRMHPQIHKNENV